MVDYTNRLVKEKSPYLLQHAHNPVDWFPWGNEAFEKAVAEDKPVFLSIGYSTCHWCHVMERESFSDPEVGKVMNDVFVCVKVDREERPDVDKTYMEICQAMTGGGGWPLNMILQRPWLPEPPVISQQEEYVVRRRKFGSGAETAINWIKIPGKF